MLEPGQESVYKGREGCSTTRWICIRGVVMEVKVVRSRQKPMSRSVSRVAKLRVLGCEESASRRVKRPPAVGCTALASPHHVGSSARLEGGSFTKYKYTYSRLLPCPLAVNWQRANAPWLHLTGTTIYP